MELSLKGEEAILICNNVGSRNCQHILREKSLAIIMGFPIGDLFSIISFLLAGVQTCQLFENDLMATCKRSKETNSDFKVRI